MDEEPTSKCQNQNDMQDRIVVEEGMSLGEDAGQNGISELNAKGTGENGNQVAGRRSQKRKPSALAKRKTKRVNALTEAKCQQKRGVKARTRRGERRAERTGRKGKAGRTRVELPEAKVGVAKALDGASEMEE